MHDWNFRLTQRFLQAETEIRRIRDNARLLMESKLMHELVHWGRARVTGLPAGVRRENKNKPELKELGWKFEEKAYKRRINAKALMIEDYF